MYLRILFCSVQEFLDSTDWVAYEQERCIGWESMIRATTGSGRVLSRVTDSLLCPHMKGEAAMRGVSHKNMHPICEGSSPRT